MPTVLITGASRGIGLALAETYAQRGDDVIATARRPADSPALAELARETGRLTVIAMDVSSEGDVNRAAGELAGRAIDIIINNAGVLATYGGLEAQGNDEAAWRTTLMTNVAGPFFVTRAFLPHLKAGGQKKLVIISSDMASSSRAPGGAYSYRASKAAATNLARNLASDLAREAIAVAAYHPGWVQTEMGGAGASISARTSADALATRIDHLSLATTGTWEDYRGTRLTF